ncbi:hypothetical protein ACFWP5_38255, partial [Streptomyces sp. NPDC058469]|uniref:hypothetical protein n=1 Tax=Streptomyces sp. NPDC058469 TaxID=3346514 RepID=UPI00365C04D8
MDDPQGDRTSIGRVEGELNYGVWEFAAAENEYDVAVRSRLGGGPGAVLDRLGRSIRSGGHEDNGTLGPAHQGQRDGAEQMSGGPAPSPCDPSTRSSDFRAATGRAEPGRGTSWSSACAAVRPLCHA